MEGINVLVPSTPMVMVQRMNVPSLALTTSPCNAEVVQYMSPSNKLPPGSLNHCWKPQYKFVDSGNPYRKKNHATRTIIRRNGKRETDARLEGNSYSAICTDQSPRETVFIDPSVPLSLGLSTSLSTFRYPLDMGPSTHALLEQYLTHATNRMYPLSSCFSTSPFRSPQWFHFAVNDAAMLHGVLFAGAMYLALLQGKQQTWDTIYHESQAISIVQKRLGNPSPGLDDATLGTVSCLALGEAVLGNQQHWNMHMQGVKQMIRARGGMSCLPPFLRAKLHRVDITGAIDYAESPCIDFERSSDESIWSDLPLETLRKTSTEMTELLTISEIHPSLVPTMINLAYFTLAIKENKTKRTSFFDPIMFAEDLHWIEHDLLSFSTALPTCKPQKSELDKALKFGALLYTKAILQEFPNSLIGPSILLARLQESLSKIEISKSVTPLLGWLSLIGGVLSIGERRQWFVARLRMLMVTKRATSFGKLAGAINRLLCLRNVFENNACEDVWLEVLNNAGSNSGQEP